MVKNLPEFEYFYCVLENKNIILKIRRSKVTDYAALKGGRTGSSESTHVKKPHCWKSHVAAHIYFSK